MNDTPKRVRHTETTQRYKFCSDHGKGRPEHDVIWERANGRSIPKGYVIHHKDGNGLNNKIDNLLLLTNSEHVALHNRMRKDGTDPVDPTDPRVIKCREMAKISGKRYRERHKEEIRERDKRYREAHHEEILIRSREYDATHKEQKRIYEKTHKEQIRLRKKQYAESHREQILKARHDRYEANKEYIKEQSKLRYTEKREEILIQKREYHQRNKDIINAKDRQYRQDHLEEMRARDRKRSERTGELKNARQRLNKAISNNWSQEIIEARRKEVETIRTRLISEGKLDPRFSNKK